MMDSSVLSLDLFSMQIKSFACLLADSYAWRFTQISYDHDSQRDVCIQKITLWLHISSIDIPTSYGTRATVCPLFFLDDILVTGKDDAQHRSNLEAVLSRLEKCGLCVKREKSEFFRSSLEYLGHVIDASGLHKSTDKLCAIAEAPAPVNFSQLWSFLGLVNYYAKFVPNLATVLHPLNAIRHKEAKWKWSSECEKAF